MTDSKDSARARSAHERGLSLAKKGWHREASNKFREAVEADPDFAEGWDALAATLAECADYEESLAAALEARRRAPDDPEYAINLGLLLLDLAFPLAQSVFEEAGNYKEFEADAALGLGMLHADRGNARAALGHLRQANALVPDDPTILSELASTHLDLNEALPAIECLRQALRLEPEATGLRVELARAYVTQGLLGPAKELLEPILSATPEPPLGGRTSDPVLLGAAYVNALILAGEGAAEACVDLLASFATENEETVLEWLSDPAFQSLRPRSDFMALETKLSEPRP